MNILKAIDEKTIALHQLVLDKLQLDNNKAIDLATHAICVFALVKAIIRFDDGNVIAILLLPLTIFAAFYMSKIRQALRHLMWARLLILSVSFIPLGNTWMMQMVEYAMGVACIMQLYFMACDKPKPPTRKHSTSFA